MAWLPTLSAAVRALIFGDPFGGVYPARANPSPAAVDGRTAALRILRAYLAELTFRRAGARDKLTNELCDPIAFQIPITDIHIEWPDNEDNLRFPSVVMLATGDADYVSIGLTPKVEEETRDVYGAGTVLYWLSEYTETIALEVWASSKAERRAIKAGLEVALVPVEQMYGLRFTVPDYFNELVCFTLMSSSLSDDDDAVRNRRRLRMTIEMRMNQVALVNYAVQTPIVSLEIGPTVETDDSGPSVPAIRQDPTLPRDPGDACEACPEC